MSYTADEYDYAHAPLQYAVAQQADQRNSVLAPVLLLVSLALSFASWMGNGIPMMTDMAFGWMAVICTVTVCRELIYFPARMRIGALILYGGTMVWFCHDYFSHWFAFDFNGVVVDYPPWVVAKGAFYTILFVEFAALGMLLPSGGWLERIFYRLPEPSENRIYAWLILAAFVIGISPYFVFTSEPFYIAIFKSMVAMRSGEDTQWTVGRTGNLNYSWGGYVAQILQVGYVGGILAAFFAIMLSRGALSRVLCFAIWLFWTLTQFGTGSRGAVLFMILPVVGLVWIKYSAKALEQLQMVSKRALLYTGISMGVALFGVQIQGLFRTAGLRAADLSKIELFKSEGNTMFSEGLIGYQLFPDAIPMPYDSFPGEGAARIMPATAFRFAIGWIPRALWTNKPGIDDVGEYINQRMTGGNAANAGGGTVAMSVAGGTYVRYGSIAVAEIGLLFGWLCLCVQSALRPNLYRPFALLIVLGLCTWLFRSFRDLTPHDLYPLLIGAVAMTVLLKFMPNQAAPASEWNGQ